MLKLLCHTNTCPLLCSPPVSFFFLKEVLAIATGSERAVWQLWPPGPPPSLPPVEQAGMITHYRRHFFFFKHLSCSHANANRGQFVVSTDKVPPSCIHQKLWKKIASHGLDCHLAFSCLEKKTVYFFGNNRIFITPARAVRQTTFPPLGRYSGDD